jgi:hypothetical protein
MEWRGFHRAIFVFPRRLVYRRSYFPKITVLEKWELAAM